MAAVPVTMSVVTSAPRPASSPPSPRTDLSLNNVHVDSLRSAAGGVAPGPRFAFENERTAGRGRRGSAVTTQFSHPGTQLSR